MNVRKKIITSFTYKELLWFKRRYNALVDQVYSEGERPTESETVMNLIFHYAKMSAEYVWIANYVSFCYLLISFLYMDSIFDVYFISFCSVHVFIVACFCVRSCSALRLPWFTYLKLLRLRWRIRKYLSGDIFDDEDC